MNQIDDAACTEAWAKYTGLKAWPKSVEFAAGFAAALEYRGKQAEPVANEPILFALWWDEHPDWFCDDYVSAYKDVVEYEFLPTVLGSPRIIELRPVNRHPAPAVADFSDAYQGAREDLAIWKKRALEAEELNRKFIADINGQAFMGEPAPAVAQEPVTVLPDGSAFAVMSFPIPKDHWLYTEREYLDGECEPVELGKPILTHVVRDAVIAAVRYAIRGATNCGKEVDFDPDALVQNAVYALCGPYSKPKPEQDQSTTPAVAVNQRVGVIERYGYQALFNAIAEATKVEGGAIGVSVLDFAKSLEAATAAAEQMKGGAA